MAPSGPSDVPPEQPDSSAGPRRREASDWDWGGGWESPAPRRPTDDETPGHGRGGPAVTDDEGWADDEPRRSGTSGDGDGRRGAADGDRALRPARGDGAADDRAARTTRGAGGSTPGSGDGPTTGADDHGRRSPHLRVAVRRRAIAVAAVVAVVVVAIVAVVAFAGGDDGPAAAGADGGGLRADASAASVAAADRVAQVAAVKRYAQMGEPVYCGAGRKPWVALTFDDGPGELSPGFITLLTKERVPVTLFRIGRNVPGHEEYVKVQRNLGWDAGTHTQNHPFLAQLTPKDQRTEIEAGNRASAAVLGRPATLFRPPYESHDADTDKIVKSLGMAQILWNVDTQDSLGTTSTDEIVQTATKGLKPGSIILMHEVKPNTLAAMPRIIAAMRAKGLEPVTISRMLAEDGPSAAQLAKGYDGCQVDLTPGKAAS